jgi:hypothetical protein
VQLGCPHTAHPAAGAVGRVVLDEVIELVVVRLSRLVVPRVLDWSLHVEKDAFESLFARNGCKPPKIVLMLRIALFRNLDWGLPMKLAYL